MKITEINHVALYCCKLSKCEITVEEQKEKLKKYCKHFGLEIAKEYVDLESNKNSFNQMIEDIKSKSFNIVLSYSFDTLSKDDDELKRLVNELDKYKCELHIESSYIYGPVPKPLFRVPRRENEEVIEVRTPKKKTGCYPMFKEYEKKNPKMKEPFDWVKKYGEDTIRFEEDELFDENGEYLGVRRDVFVMYKEITGFCKPKKKQKKEEPTYIPKPLW